MITMLFFFVHSLVSNKTILKIYSIALLTTGMMFLVFLYLNQSFDGHFWQSMQQSKSALCAEYCELDQPTHFFRQTINSYSNLMYFFLGVIVIAVAIYDLTDKRANKNPLQRFPALSFLFGVCLLYLCFGSTFFHASLTWLGQRVDMNATYSICLTLIGISSYRYYIKQTENIANKAVIIIGLISLIFLFIPLHLLVSSSILLPLLISIAVFFVAKNYTNNKDKYKLHFAILSLLLVIGAFILRTLDVKKLVCNPTSIYQAHALWHMFTGMSAFLLYWFYRSEQA